MQSHCKPAMEFFSHDVHGWVCFQIVVNHTFEEIAVNEMVNQVACQHRWDGQQYQWQSHYPWAFLWIVSWCQTMVMTVVIMMVVTLVFTPTLFTPEHHEILAEAIQSRHEHRDNQSHISKICCWQL